MLGMYAPIGELSEFKQIYEIIHGGNTINKKGVIALTGCAASQKLHLVGALSEDIKVKVIVTYDEIRAREIYEEYSFFDRNVCFYPGKDLIFYQADIHGNQLVKERIRTLRRLLEKKPVTIVTTMGAMMTPQVMMTREQAVVEIEKGKTIDLKRLIQRLSQMGYDRSHQVESPGQFSLRGDILDVFDLTEDNPFRIELWGDEVESIRSFDALSQRSIENLSSIALFPATEFILDKERIESGAEQIRKEAKENEEKLRGMFKTEEAHRLSRIHKEMLEQLLELHGKVNLESYIRYFYPNDGELLSMPKLLSKMSPSLAFFLEEPLRIKEAAEAMFNEFQVSFTQRLEMGYVLPRQVTQLYSGEVIAAELEKLNMLTMSSLDSGPGYFKPDYKFEMGARNTISYNGDFEALAKDLGKFCNKKYRVILFSGSRTRAARLAQDLRSLEVPAVFVEDPMRAPLEGEVMVAYGHISKGFEYPLLRFAVFTEDDVFAKKKEKKRRKSNYDGQKVGSLEDLKPGDYVVHETYGLGVYKGIEKVEAGHVVRDYIKLEYREGGVLFVLATELDAIQKYASSDVEKKPKVNKLGTKEWERTTTKVKAAVCEVATDLVQLYAKRQQENGYAYGKDTVWQKEFEELFPYEETEDQLAAIEATKADMEAEKIMDRLICGDVGFGKTEIAIRAAFKAVQEGKQVAYLVPTTILAQQHYRTFVQRMKDYPVRIDLMSRFKTAKEISQTVADLKTGQVDIVIGTHRILSKDVQFKDLGLLIIDEEQRFGVTHKEKIKQLKENVDVLTLSATPIPRTLHMSLVGIRDMSLLEEAPNDRLPIQTYVCEYDAQMVREAIVRELARGGQVYYVYNRVRMIADVTASLREMIPEARIEYAHGQMSERELEDIMYDFVSGDIDVLVSTTIIETGMDISNVNTLIIQDSDTMGLSQLYQLRGRVGRSNRVAYAFLMYRRDKILTEVAEKRLEAIREFTDLGSGFRIALRDLEIRGAGNLLGKTQHGHMEAVGYDLYCKMLNEEVSRLKGIPVKENFSTVINLDVDAYIPAEYILNEEQKLDMYKRIASVENAQERDDLKDELLDRFGEIPLPALNLIKISLLRERAHKLYMTEVRSRDGRIVFSFRPNAKINPANIPELVKKHAPNLTFTAYGTPSLTYKYEREALVEKEEQQLLTLADMLLSDMQILAEPDDEEAV